MTETKLIKKAPEKSLAGKLHLLRNEGVNICRHAHILVSGEPVGGELEKEIEPRVLFRRYQRWFMQLRQLLNRPAVTKVVDIEILFREPGLVSIPSEAYLQRKVFAADILAKTEKKLQWLEENHPRLTRLLSRASSQEPTGKITRITLINLKQKGYTFVVNNDFKTVKKVRRHSSWWEKMIEVVKDRRETVSEDMKDYFNYNKVKCALYSSGKYKLTEIFVGREPDIQLNSEIEAEIISEATLKKRQNKTGSPT